MVGLFLAFPFGCWGIYSGRRGGGTIFFTFRFAFSFAWSFTLSVLALAFTFAFTFAFGNVRVGRIVVSNIPVIHREGWGRGWVSSDPWGTKRSSARGTYRCDTRLLYPRGMTIRYECWEKGICVPTSQRSFPSCSKVFCRMCFHKGQPLRGKVPNHKNLRCQCSSQGPVLRQNGETYYNPDANSGLH